jgi:hypothetical protein
MLFGLRIKVQSYPHSASSAFSRAAANGAPVSRASFKNVLYAGGSVFRISAA